MEHKHNINIHSMSNPKIETNTIFLLRHIATNEWLQSNGYLTSDIFEASIHYYYDEAELDKASCDTPEEFEIIGIKYTYTLRYDII